MADHTALYGLMSGLPALSLDEPAQVTLPVWQVAANWLKPHESDVLGALYAPAQWQAHLGRATDPTAFLAPPNWRVYQTDLEQAEAMPFREALRQERAACKSWLQNQPYELLHHWLQLTEQLENRRLQQLRAGSEWINELLSEPPAASLDDLELPSAELALWEHTADLYEQAFYTDRLLWHWLTEQVFYRPFSFEALLSYALREQMQHRWWVLGQAETTPLLEKIIHESAT